MKPFLPENPTASPTGTSGTVELAAAEYFNGTPFPNATATLTQVTNMLIGPFTVGTRPFIVAAEFDYFNDTINKVVQVQLEESTDGGAWTAINYLYDTVIEASGVIKVGMTRRRNPAEGASVRYRLTLAAPSGGTATIYSDATAGPQLSAIQV
jgi:hypothetical protein